MSETVKYIDSLDISRVDLSKILNSEYYDSEDIKKLSTYQQNEFERAKALVAQDEFVGNTFPNLEYIGNITGKPIVLTRR